MKYKTHVVIGDGHSAPDQNLERFSWIGRYVALTKPDVFVDIGDLVTFDSCSFFDVPRRYKTTAQDDIETAIYALDLIDDEIDAENVRLTKNKKKKYRPHRVFCHGNHEYRFNRRLQADEDVLGSLVDLDELLGTYDRFDEVCQYKDFVDVDGILYTHAVHNGRGTPMGGVTRGRAINAMSDMPVVYGHTHKFDFTSTALLGNTNRQVWSLNLPAFMDQDHVEEYATGSTTGWAYGAVEIKVYEDGNSVYRWISMAELKEFYERNK